MSDPVSEMLNWPATVWKLMFAAAKACMMFSTRGDGCPMASSLTRSKRMAMSVPCRKKTRCPVGTYLASAASCKRICDSSESSRSKASLGCGSKRRPIMVNKTPFPLGRQNGRRWFDSPPFGSGLVNISGSPPSAETLERPTSCPFVNTMLLSRAQFAPKIEGAPQRTLGTPPSIGTFCNLSSAQNPTQRLSGERKGLMPPSVPAIGLASDWSILRKYNRLIA